MMMSVQCRCRGLFSDLWVFIRFLGDVPQRRPERSRTIFACARRVPGGADAGNSLVLLVYPAGRVMQEPAPQKLADVFNAVFAWQGGVHGGLGVAVLWSRPWVRGVFLCFCGGGEIFSAGADYRDDDDADPVTSHSVVKRLRQRRRTVALYTATPFRKVHLWCTV